MNKSIKIFFAGDFCSKPSTSYIIPSDEIKELIQSCDIKIVNFEVPLKPLGVDISKIRFTFQPRSVRETLHYLKICLFNNVKRSDREFLYMLKNDLKRSRLIKMMK